VKNFGAISAIAEREREKNNEASGEGRSQDLPQA
jgi:hypothetical protein